MGDSSVSGNTFIGGNGVVRAIDLTSTTGSSPFEVYGGTLRVSNNTISGVINQLYTQDNFAGDAGGFTIIADGNTGEVNNASFILFGTTSGFGNLFNSFTLTNNEMFYSLQGSSKGLLGVDGSGSFRSSGLPVTFSGNTVYVSGTTDPVALRSDYIQVSGSTDNVVAYKSGVTSVLVIPS
jgi:hypothetical protein